MKNKTILLLLAALALLTCSCGSDDEPQVTQSTMKDVKELDGITAQQVSMSLNRKMKIAVGNIYAITQADRIRNFKSGAFGLEVGAPITYVKVTEFIKENDKVIGFHYQTKTSTAERGNLPEWEINHRWVKEDHSNDYEQRLLVEYTLDSHIYIRYGGVCTRAIVRQK